MKKALFIVAAALLALPARAALNVFACEPEWAALAQELGGERVKATSATTALQDPHHVEARPSLVARIRNADLVVCTGAELEAGWLPVLLQQGGNARVQPGNPGYFEAASFVTLLDRPAKLDRAQGDVHGAGDPHVQLDPRRLLPIAEALSKRLVDIDRDGAATYIERGRAWQANWKVQLARWEKVAAPLKGVPVVTQHRPPYLVDWLGLVNVATLEPKPGVEPSATHLAQLAATLAKTPAKLIVRAAYHDARPANWLADKSGLPVAVIPFTVGGSDAAKDLVGLYDDTLRRLLAAAGAGK